jgi:C-type mannose receptor
VGWSSKCGPGWEDDPATDFCYQFNDHQLDWRDAKTSCRYQLGDLISIQLPREQAYIRGKMNGETPVDGKGGFCKHVPEHPFSLY